MNIRSPRVVLLSCQLLMGCYEAAAGPDARTGSAGDAGLVDVATGGADAGQHSPEGGLPANDASGAMELGDASARRDDAASDDASAFEPCAAVNGSVTVQNTFDLRALRGCKTVSGNLNITAPGLTSLDGLQSLQRVDGTLTIANTSLTSLEALAALEAVGKDLIVNNDKLLADLGGVANLRSVGGSVTLAGTALRSLRGLEKLTSVGGALTISGNLVLESLSGLDGLRTIGGEVAIEFNSALTSLAGLRVTELRSLKIASNIKLVDLRGLEALTHVESELRVSGPEITSLNGLQGLLGVKGRVVLQACAKLTSLSGLKSLRFVGDLLQLNIVGIRDLSGLEKIEQIGSLYPVGNPVFSSFSGLNPGVLLGTLTVGGNAALTAVVGLPETITHLSGSLNVDNSLLGSLSGLEHVSRIDGDLSIFGNAQLTSLAGLSPSAHVGGNIRIGYNRMLPKAAATSYASAIGKTCECEGNL